MNATCLLAISYAHLREFQRARDTLYEFVPRNRADEMDIEYAERRIVELESRAITGGAE